MVAIIVMMNNYFHDVATALLAASGALMLVLLSVLREAPTPDAAAFVVRLYPKMTLVARIALAWILLGGVPRVIFFTDFELWDAANKGIYAALAVKHVVMFGLVGGGALLWTRLRRRVAELQRQVGTPPSPSLEPSAAS